MLRPPHFTFLLPIVPAECFCTKAHNPNKLASKCVFSDRVINLCDNTTPINPQRVASLHFTRYLCTSSRQADLHKRLSIDEDALDYFITIKPAVKMFPRELWFDKFTRPTIKCRHVGGIKT